MINITDYKTTNDYDNNTSSNNTTLSFCTDSEFNIDTIIPSLLLTIPCALSFLCLIVLLVYTLIKPLFNNKRV